MPDLDRRSFLKAAGATAASLTACHGEPVNKIIPYVAGVEEFTVGISTYYASTCRECSASCGLHVKTREGRPIKLEGNPDHPVNRGSLCARGQAGIGRTYHPDRYRQPMRRSGEGGLEPISWDEAIALAAEKIGGAAGRTFLLGSNPGPTLGGLLDDWVQAVGAGGRVVFEPFAAESLRAATADVFGRETEPRFDLSKADLVIDFGSDFMESGLSPTEHSRQIAEARDLAKHAGGGARLVYVGPRMSLTASNAEEWIPARPGTEGILAMAIGRAALAAGAGGASGASLRRLTSGFDAKKAAERTGVDEATILRLGRAVATAEAPIALPPGVALTGRRATATASAVLLLNAVGGAIGKTLHLPADTQGTHASFRDVLTLTESMKSGKVAVLLVHGANPAYALPKSSEFEAALEKVGFVISFASIADETSERADLVLPDHSPLESWGDAQPRSGVRSLQQPTLRPLFDTRALGDSLLDIARAMGGGAATGLPEGSFRTILARAWADTDLEQALTLGGVFDEAASEGVAAVSAGLGSVEVTEPLLEGDGSFVLMPFPTGLLSDGSGANLPWLQEIPDPVTKIAWQSWCEVSNRTAENLGVEFGDVLAIETPNGRLELPVVPRGGLRDDVVAVPIGQGHSVGHYASMASEGRPGEVRGANVLDLLPVATDESGARAWLSVKAQVSATGRYERLPLLQTNDNKRERMLGQSIALAAFKSGEKGAAYPRHEVDHGGAEHGDDHHAGDSGAADPARVDVAAAPAGEGHGGGHHEHPDPHLYAPYDPADDVINRLNGQVTHDDEQGTAPYRWGMTIDLDRCNGCSACVAACYVENNIPIVGERETVLGRHMSWLRIERWVGDGEVEFGGGRPRPRSTEGYGGKPDVRHSPMLCQHCGAAPCEPVCPVFATYHNPEGLNGMIYNRCIGTRYCSNNCSYKVRRFNWYDNQIENWPEPMRLMLNPDVTVRGQGVMEKCTFCYQRIETARQPAKDVGRLIADGEVVTACQQACPTQAISFGNLRDAKSEVSRKASDPVRGYHALHDLNTRPAITYLAQVARGEVEV